MEREEKNSGHAPADRLLLESYVSNPEKKAAGKGADSMRKACKDNRW